MSGTALRSSPLLLGVALALLGLGSGAAAATPTRDGTVVCATVKVGAYGSRQTYAYSVRVAAGHVSCAAAEKTMRVFLAKAVSPPGWFCVRGHAGQSQAWAATCARTDGALVRAYGPIHG